MACDLELQRCKVRYSNYFYLCVDVRFSKIESHSYTYLAEDIGNQSTSQGGFHLLQCVLNHYTWVSGHLSHHEVNCLKIPAITLCSVCNIILNRFHHYCFYNSLGIHLHQTLPLLTKESKLAESNK